jgi:hypothetical protein
MGGDGLGLRYRRTQHVLDIIAHHDDGPVAFRQVERRIGRVDGPSIPSESPADRIAEAAAPFTETVSTDIAIRPYSRGWPRRPSAAS